MYLKAILLCIFALEECLGVHDNGYTTETPNGQIIPGEFLIALHEKTASNKGRKNSFIQQLSNEYHTEVKNEFIFDQLQILHVLSDEENMAHVGTFAEVANYEPNRIVHLEQTDQYCRTVSVEQWGLGRINQRESFQKDEAVTGFSYTYGAHDAGKGVTVYVVDSGIEIGHPDFGGRAEWGFTVPGLDGDMDLNGHGTHVAGSVGSNSFGVAPEVELVAVKVFNASGSGTTASIMNGLKFVYKDHLFVRNETKRKSICNLSLGGPASEIENNAVKQLIHAGITVVVAAGNENEDACFTSPASVTEAVTVGASGYLDETAYFTNWGLCVDMFAPGQGIMSTDLGNTFRERDGTSMAAPHVAGAVARYMGALDQVPSPAAVKQWLSDEATTGHLQFLSDSHATSPDKLLYVNCESLQSPTINSVYRPTAGMNIMMYLLLCVVLIMFF